MNRQKIIIGATVLFAITALVYWVCSGWGLITVEVNDKPLAEVIRSIERQGGIVLKTNMDTTRPVTMHVHKVPLTEALQTLAERMDGRWRLGYVFGPDNAALKVALDAISSGKRPEGWKNYDVPLFGRGDSLGDEAVPMDPRRDQWNVKAPDEKTLQAFLQAAATGVSASFMCPENYNPAVGKAPSSGEIRKSAPQLAKIASAKVQEVFLLMGRPAGAAESERGREDDGAGGFGPPRLRGGREGERSSDTRADGQRGGNFALMRERQLAEIAKLPAGEQQAARAEFEEREKFFTALRELPEEERRAKADEYFNRPETQDRMADRRMLSQERKSPQQRTERYKSYVARKQQAANAKSGK